jgi:hypothetical protein
VKKTRREHIFVEEGISQVGSDRNTRELCCGRRRDLESTIIMENFTGTQRERERERERGRERFRVWSSSACLF